MNRRDFVKTGALLSSSIILPFPFMEAESKIKIAIVGTGWWARDFLLPNLLANGNFEVIAICDVDSEALKTTTNKLKEANENEVKTFSDYLSRKS